MLAYQIDGRHEQATGPDAFIERPSLPSILHVLAKRRPANEGQIVQPPAASMLRDSGKMQQINIARSSAGWAGR